MSIPVTLDKTLRDRVDTLIHLEFNKFRQEVKHEVSTASADLGKGLIHGGYAISQVHNICAQQVQKRADAVWRVMKRVMETVGMPSSETLRQDLKTYVDYYVPASLWELPEIYDKTGGSALYDTQLGALLLQEREQALATAHVEIDLYVDGLQAKAKKVQVTSQKERDQKHGVLLSSKQAARDFEDWKINFRPGEGSIAVLFIDIDHFKALNTKYTERVIDKTILSEVLHLLANLVDQRGGAYQEGGDEFILILPNHDKNEAVIFADKLRARVASQQFRVDNQTETLTVSGGVAMWPEHGATYEDVALKANLAKKTAKEKSRNVIIVADAPASPEPVHGPVREIASAGFSENEAVVIWRLPRGFVLLSDLEKQDSVSWATIATYYHYNGHEIHSTHFHKSYRWDSELGAMEVQCVKLGIPRGDWTFALAPLHFMMEVRRGIYSICHDGTVVETQGNLAIQSGIAAVFPAGKIPFPAVPSEYLPLVKSGSIRDLAAEAGDLLNMVRFPSPHTALPLNDITTRVNKLRREVRIEVHRIFGDNHPVSKNLEELIVRYHPEDKTKQTAWLDEFESALLEAVQCIEGRT